MMVMMVIVVRARDRPWQQRRRVAGPLRARSPARSLAALQQHRQLRPGNSDDGNDGDSGARPQEHPPEDALPVSIPVLVAEFEVAPWRSPVIPRFACLASEIRKRTI